MTAPPPLPSAGRADRARRAASTVDPSNPIRPGPRSCPRRVGHGRHPGPWTKDQEAEWATSMRVGHQHALRASGPHHANGPMGHMPDQSCGPREGPCKDGPSSWTTLTDHGPFGGPTKYVVHAKAHAGTATRTTPGPWTGPDDGVPVHRATVQGPYGQVGGWTRFMRSMAREPTAIGPVSPNAHGAEPCASRGAPGTGAASPTVDEQAPDRGRLPVRQEPAPAGAPCPASVRQPAPNKQRHNRHIREIKPDMKTSTQTDEKARHRNQKQRRQNQEPTQPATRYDAIRKPKKKHIPMQSPKEMDFLHPPPRGGRLSAERQRF